MRLLLGALGFRATHDSGRSFSREMPFCSGPRQLDQSAARPVGVVVAASVKSSRGMRRFMGKVLSSGGQSDFVCFMAGRFARLATCGLAIAFAIPQAAKMLISSQAVALSSRSAAAFPVAPLALPRGTTTRLESSAPRAPRLHPARHRVIRSQCVTSIVSGCGRPPGDTRRLQGNGAESFGAAPGCTLLPRSTIISSARPRTPPSRRMNVQPHGHGCGSTRTKSPVR